LVGPNLIDWARNVLGYASGPGMKREIGVVNGQTITLAEFEGLTLKNVELQKLNQQKPDLTAEEIFNIKNQTFDERVRQIIMHEEYDNLGLIVSQDEMIDQLRGHDPHRLIRQYFVNERGVYDPNLVVQYMQNLPNMDPRDRAQWENFKEFIYEDRLNSKYQSLVSKSFHYPSAMAEMDYHDASDMIDVRYVGINYSNIADTLVEESTDEQFRNYYEEVKHKYIQGKSRDIEYVVFDILPSDEDLRAIEEETMEIYNEWIHSANPGRYVNNIPGNVYDSTWYSKGELSLFIDSLMFAAEPGTFKEPYQENQAWHMARLMDRQVRPDSASAEHVLIAYQGAFRANPEIKRSREEASRLADSIHNVLKRDVSKLEEIAMSMSDDASVANNNGNIGWFRDGEMVYPFNNAAINGKVGDVVLVETAFGFHVIHVTGQTEEDVRVRVAQIEVPIEYSSETHDRYYAIAARFAGENNTLEKFNEAVIEQGLEKREAKFVREMQLNLPSLENTRQVIRWIFWDDRKIGDVSSLFDLGGKFIVAAYTDGREEGVAPFETVREQIENNLRNERKAEYLTEKISALGTNDIYAIARAFNTSVDSLSDFAFNARNIPGFGTENEVVGQFFTFDEGENTGILKGNAGLFVAEIDKVNKAPDIENYSLYINRKVNDLSTRVLNNYHFNALKKEADIKDYRRYFY
jgi:peptidyl-prolyl cis-trans isomerase D